jgi:hypothetical protein
MIKEMLKNIGSGKPFLAMVLIDNDDGYGYATVCFNGKFYIRSNSSCFTRVTKLRFISTIKKVISVVEYNNHDIFDQRSYSIQEFELKKSDLIHRHKKLSIICDN